MPLACEPAPERRAETPQTCDAVLGGAVVFRQPARGYRVNIDSVLLAHFAAAGRSAELALDLGAGVGLLSLLLHHLGAARRFTLVERETELSSLARQNLASAGVPGNVLECDLSLDGLPSTLLRAAELVVSNPPFFAEGQHRAPHDGQRQRARIGPLEPFLQAAASALEGNKARAVFAYPARALTELLVAATEARLVPKRLRFVHAFSARAARLALIELRVARPGGLVIEAPLIEWEAPGVPTAELARLTRARADGPT